MYIQRARVRGNLSSRDVRRVIMLETRCTLTFNFVNKLYSVILIQTIGKCAISFSWLLGVLEVPFCTQ